MAKLAGVSIATVSRCMNNPDKVGKKTLTRVKKAINDLHYSPNLLAQNFRRGKSNLIMVVVPHIGMAFFSDVLEGIRSVLDDNYMVVLMETRTHHQHNSHFIDMVVSKQVEGVILLATHLPFDLQLTRAHKASPIPLVIGLEPYSSDLAQFPNVHIDNLAAAHEATSYLIRAGHKHICFISGPENSMITLDRELGFRSAMQQAGLELTPDCVRYTELNLSGGMMCAQYLLTQAQRPTAIFCANDDIAMGVMSVARKLGLNLPDDLSIMGFDDTPYSEVCTPRLSTVHQPAHDIGRRVALRLLKDIETPLNQAQRVEILPHKLVIRDSIRALRSDT